VKLWPLVFVYISEIARIFHLFDGLENARLHALNWHMLTLIIIQPNLYVIITNNIFFAAKLQPNKLICTLFPGKKKEL